MDIMEDFVDNFYAYDIAGHLVEGDDDEGENEIYFDTVDIIDEDSSEHDEIKNEIYGENFKLVIND